MSFTSFFSQVPDRSVQKEKTLPSRKRMMLIRLQAGRTYLLEVRAMTNASIVILPIVIVAMLHVHTNRYVLGLYSILSE